MIWRVRNLSNVKSMCVCAFVRVDVCVSVVISLILNAILNFNDANIFAQA